MPRPWEKPRRNQPTTSDAPPRWSWPIASVVIVAAIIIGLKAVTSWLLRPTEPASPNASSVRPNGEYDLTCLAAFDISGSMNEEEKRTACEFVSQLLNEAIQVKAQVATWEYAETCATLDELDVEVRRDMTTQLESLIGATRGNWGTRPSLVLQEFFRFLTSDRAKSSRIILLLATDGEMHDQPETVELGRQLASVPNVHALVVGPVNKEQRAAVRETFRDFGTRLVLFGETDRRRAVNDVLRLLQQGESQ